LSNRKERAKFSSRVKVEVEAKKAKKFSLKKKHSSGDMLYEEKIFIVGRHRIFIFKKTGKVF
jgi:hypothetical protein